jgi:hypothetical protein
MSLKSRLVPGIGFITILALLIRIFSTTWTGLTTDEANGVMLAVTGTWADMLQHLREDGNAPVFYALVRAYAHFFGYHGIALKFFSIFIATLTVPISYWLFRRVLARELCLALALMLAFCPTFVCYGVLIRPYAIEGVLGLISTFACIRVLSPKTNLCRIIVYGVTTALLVYTHYWGAFVPIGHVGLVLVGLTCRWFGKREVAHWLAGAVLALLLFLPQVISVCMVVYGVKYNLSAFDVAPRPLTLACDFLPTLLLSTGKSPHLIVMFLMYICDFLVFLTFISPKVMMVTGSKGSETGEIIYDGRMWKAATICGLVAAFCVDLISPSMRYRYLMPFVPMIFIVFITGFNALFVKKSRLVRVVLPCMIWTMMFIPYLLALISIPETTTGAVVNKIADSADRSKDVVLIAWEIIAPAINFDLPADIQSISYPHLERSNINHWTDMAVRLRSPDILPQLFGKLQAILDKGGNIWLVDTRHMIRPLDYRNNDLIRNIPFMNATVIRSDQIRSWLVTHAIQIGETQVAPGRDFSIILSVFAPVGDDPRAKTALPKLDKLWHSIDSEENIRDLGDSGAQADGRANSKDQR